MHRYLLFLYNVKKPQGGWLDFVESFDNLEKAKQKAKNITTHRKIKDNIQIEWHIFDKEKNEMVVAHDCW